MPNFWDIKYGKYFSITIMVYKQNPRIIRKCILSRVTTCKSSLINTFDPWPQREERSQFIDPHHRPRKLVSPSSSTCSSLTQILAYSYTHSLSVLRQNGDVIVGQAECIKDRPVNRIIASLPSCIHVSLVTVFSPFFSLCFSSFNRLLSVTG